MQTAQEIISAASAAIEKWRLELPSKLIFDVDKSKFTQDEKGNRRAGRFLKLYIRVKKPDGKVAGVLTQTLHEFSANELEPDETILKQVESAIIGNKVIINVAATAAPVAAAQQTVSPPVVLPPVAIPQTAVPTPTQVSPPPPPPPAPVSPPPAPPPPPPPVVVPPPPPPAPAPIPPFHKFKPIQKVRVNTPGSCLHERMAGSLSAGIIQCIPDGAIIEVQTYWGNNKVDGYDWAGTRYLNRDGWVADDFLVAI